MPPVLNFTRVVMKLWTASFVANMCCSSSFSHSVISQRLSSP